MVGSYQKVCTTLVCCDGLVQFFAGVSGFGELPVVVEGRCTNAVQFTGFPWARKVLYLRVRHFSICKKRKIQANKSIGHPDNTGTPCG
jgi:hypothetical protein